MITTRAANGEPAQGGTAPAGNVRKRLGPTLGDWGVRKNARKQPAEPGAAHQRAMALDRAHPHHSPPLPSWPLLENKSPRPRHHPKELHKRMAGWFISALARALAGPSYWHGAGWVWLIHHHRSCRTRELPSYLPPPACTRFPTHQPPPAATARPSLPLLYTGHRTHSPLQGIALSSPGPQPETTKHRTEPCGPAVHVALLPLVVVGRWALAFGSWAHHTSHHAPPPPACRVRGRRRRQTNHSNGLNAQCKRSSC